MTVNLKPNEIDITNINHIQFLIDEWERPEEKERKFEAWKSFQVYAGNQGHYVKERLKEVYPETWRKFRVGDISLSQDIVGQKAKAYKKSPLRSLDKDAETEAYDAIIDRGEFDRAFMEMDVIFNRDKYVFMWVTHIDPDLDPRGEGYYQAHALAPYEYSLVRDEVTGEVLVFGFSFPSRDITGDVGSNDGVEQVSADNQADSSAETKEWAIWSKKNHVKVKVSLKSKDTSSGTAKREVQFIDIPGNPNNENGFNRIPGTFINEDLSVDWPVRSNLHNQSIDWNVCYSDYKTAGCTQGHGQLVITHPEKQKIRQVHLGQHTAIKLPQSSKESDKPTDAKYINPNPNLGDWLEGLKFDYMKIAAQHRVKAGQAVNGSSDKFTSGFDRLLAMADTQEVVERNQTLYAKAEDDIYQIIKSAEVTMNRKTFTSESLTVVYERPTVLISDKELIDNIERMVEIGLIEEHEKFMIMNPRLSEEEAMEKLERVDARKRERMQDFQDSLRRNSNGQANEEAGSESGERTEGQEGESQA